MLKNYLKIAFRNLLKSKGYSLINILGLTVGLSCCILILLHIEDEFSYDTFFPKGDRIHRMALERIYPDHRTFYSIIPAGYAEVVEEEFPEVESAVRLFNFGQNAVVKHEDRSFIEQNFVWADSNFFDVFDLTLVQGDPETALKGPNKVVLNRETAQKYFAGESPIGKTLETDFGDYEVTGVVQNVPPNSHFEIDFLGSSATIGVAQQQNFISFSAHTYLLLHPAASPDQVEAKIPEIVERYAGGQIEREQGISFEQYQAAGNGYRYFLQPLQSIHLYSNLEGEFKPNGNITYVYVFISISIFVLLIACVNFMNLATARSADRAKEVGIRKVMGSDRRQLIMQFLTESVALSLISLVLAVGVIQMVLPWFNDLVDKQLLLNLTGQSWILPGLLGFALFVGLLAGSYPAFYISSLNAVEVMKGKFQSNRKGIWLRNGLVIFQFSISIILIAGTMVVYNQMQFIRNKQLGFDKEEVMIVNRANALEDQASAFKQQLKNISFVRSVSGASAVPGGFYFGFQFQEENTPEVVTTRAMSVDDNYVETLGLQMVTGRDFSESFNDSLNVLVNEAVVRLLGVAAEEAVGMRFTTDNVGNQLSTFTIAGVVGDYNYQSLHTAIEPLVILSTEGGFSFEPVIAVRLEPGNASKAVQELEAMWKEFAPGEPFLFSFLDTELDQLYQSEQRSSTIFSLFTALAIIIASVGLLGLAAYTAYQRTKEIGVRKVLGATVPNVVFLLSKDFARLVIVAFLVAAPLAWIVMQQWLENFAYRIEMSMMTFIWAGLIALVIAWLTISWQAVSAALANPVESLRSE